MDILNRARELSLDIRDVFRPVLSDRKILEYNKKGLLIKEQLQDHQVQPNSIDLTLGNTWKKIIPNIDNARHLIDPRKPIEYREGIFNDKLQLLDIQEICYIIRPREFILMASNETLNIPNGIISFVQGRSSIARLGIQTEQAGLIDAGFKGTITFEVYNQADYPIILYEGMRIAQVYFFKAQRAHKIYGLQKGSKYSDQLEATGSRIHLDSEFSTK